MSSFQTSRCLGTIDRPLLRIARISSNQLDTAHFRERAFNVEQPLLIATHTTPGQAIPAADKWFERESLGPDIRSKKLHHIYKPSQSYLSPFNSLILPYELTARPNDLRQTQTLEPKTIDDTETPGFRKFDAPLSVFLQNSALENPLQLYIAQAQVSSLPKQLQDDLPTPKLVLEAGKGDVYDANLWMGIGSTCTPLHKDPNPNLFMQLAGCKKIRLFSPVLGGSIIHRVLKEASEQRLPGFERSEPFQLEKMMVGHASNILDTYTWGNKAPSMGYEVTVYPGDQLFIPMKWWHTIKSDGAGGITASVNWWFR